MEINRKKLLRALEIVKPGLANNELIEQTTSFCFVDGKVVTYNDTISISCPLEEIEVEGAVNSKELYGFVSRVKSEEITLEQNDNEILLKSGRSKALLTLQSKILIPLDPVKSDKKWVSLPDTFSQGLRFCAAACSKDMSMAKLTGVHINKNILEATDNNRIAQFKLDKAIRGNSFILKSTEAFLIAQNNPTHLALAEGWAHFKLKNESVISCRYMDEDFVDVSQFLNVEGEKLVFPKDIMEIIERAEVFAKRDIVLDEMLEIQAQNKRMIVKAKSESGRFEEKCRANYNGEDVSFLVTPYLIKDILKQTFDSIVTENSLLFEGENWKYLTLLRG